MSSSQRSTGIHISLLCKRTGISRQGYYKQSEKQKKEAIKEEFVVKKVKEIRKLHRKQGSRKLYHNLSKEMQRNNIKMGRDRFIELLRRNDLLIRRRRKYARTTQSRHSYPKYGNIIRNLEPSRRNESWASDITYISTHEGFLYLALITDMYSRKIVGFEVSDNLETTGCIKALKMALRDLRSWEHPVHHSDRGIQYCSAMYTELLRKNHLPISMTEEDHCAENALAERMNGILKDEYMLDHKFISKKQAKAFCKEAIRLYNTDRPHLSLNYRKPAEVHAEYEPRIRHEFALAN
jgi:putative transposase